MCRSTTMAVAAAAYARIRAFYVRLEINDSQEKRLLPEALTLVYLPCISGITLEINGSKIRTASSSFVPLHRIRSADSPEPNRRDEAIYASTDRVRIGDGAGFEVYVGAELAMKGVFRNGGGGEWKVQLSACAAERKVGVATAEVVVAAEGGETMVEKVRMARRKKVGFCSKLEEIPEEADGCDCSCCGEEEEYDDRDEKEEGWELIGTDDRDEVLEMEVEGLKWAVDLGIWAVCLGVGLLVSRASHKHLRKKLFF